MALYCVGNLRILKLCTIGLSDYSVLEGQRIGRIRLAEERLPPAWLWSVQIHLPGGLPMGSAEDRATAMAEFQAAWEKLKEPGRRPSSLRRRTGHEHSRRRVSP